jgi:hypothetical protein
MRGGSADSSEAGLSALDACDGDRRLSVRGASGWGLGLPAIKREL